MNPRRRNLPLLLLHAREAAMSHFRPILKHFGLTDQQWRIIRVLGEAPDALEPGQIADACKILSPSLTGILARLVETGIIAREWSALDQRRQLVSLTPTGRALVDRMTPLIDRQYRLLEAALGAEALNAAYDVLDNMLALLRRDVPSVIAPDQGMALVNGAGKKRAGSSARKKAKRTGDRATIRSPIVAR